MIDWRQGILGGLSLRTIAATYALGAAGGLAADAAGLPLPMLLGSLVAVALAASLRLRLPGGQVAVPQKWRFALVPVIGVAIGGGLTPDALAQARQWWVTLVALVAFVPVAHAMAFVIFRRLGAVDPVTAYYAAIPGGLIESLQMGEEAGARVQMLTMLQFLRLILCIVLVPLAFAFVTGHAVGSGAGVRLAGAGISLSLTDVLVLLAAAVGGAWLGGLMRLPAAMISGPILLSALAHVTGLTQAGPPAWVLTVAQVVVGTSLGARFVGLAPAEMWLAARLAAVNTFAALVLALAIAATLAGPAGVEVAAVFLAFAPGGIAEMSLVALSLQVSAVYVTLHHILRIVVAVGFARAGRRFVS